LDGELEAILGVVAVLEDSLDSLIDFHELVALFWKLFLYFFRVDEQVLKERPGTLDLLAEESDL